MDNANSTDYLEKIKRTVIENIRRTGKPSVEALSEVPRHSLARGMESDDEDEEDDLDADMNADQRITQRQRDKMVVPDNEFDDASDDEEYRNGLGVRRQPGEARRRGIMSFQNPDALPDEVESDGPRGLNGESARTTSQPSPAPVGGESRASSRPAANGATPTVAADEDGDVDMGDATPMENGSPVQEMQDETPSAPQEAAPADTTAPVTAPAAPADVSTDASPSGVVTPPDSPPAAPAAASTSAPAPAPAPESSEGQAPAGPSATEDVEMGEDSAEARAEAIQKEKDEGLKERTEENERAEAETEAKADA
jgi:histone deacetylase 1/2